MTTVFVAGLIDQIASIGSVDMGMLDRLHHEALTIPMHEDWVAEYGPYQSGSWFTTSLMNDSGVPRDVRIADCTPKATSLLDRMPATRAYLQSLGLRYMWVRLARLGPNGFLWEHRDYDDLEKVERFRLHVPLVTNSSAALILGGARIHLRPGRVWRLAPTHVHGACNLLGPDRLHLILDCYRDIAFDALTADSSLEADVLQLPEPDAREIDSHSERARSLIRLGYLDAAEKHLLRLFYRYTLPEGTVYDLIASAYEEVGRPDKARAWRKDKVTLLGLSR
ncbi:MULTISPECIES: aspartyl/asparaginyl beta-hydroxylase domain-containing protein [unclassified Nocardia]|uniref:aspartyl/asparaginyl beta-hydroxylase domain-containing protein n=1 Tax=unclassified Nocardia TaxID=2637762 RepID=UPI00278BD99C|nr:MULTISPECIES: aspartyl/asparaginyl beta-hydroxylase domain-containing protein [unclassified Nocardia]